MSASVWPILIQIHHVKSDLQGPDETFVRQLVAKNPADVAGWIARDLHELTKDGATFPPAICIAMESHERFLWAVDKDAK